MATSNQNQQPAVSPLLRIQHAHEEIRQVRTEIKSKLDRVIDTADLDTLTRITSQLGPLIQFATDDGSPVTRASVVQHVEEHRKRGRKPLYATEHERILGRRDYHRQYQADRRAAQKLGVETEDYRILKGLEWKVADYRRMKKRGQHAFQRWVEGLKPKAS